MTVEQGFKGQVEMFWSAMGGRAPQAEDSARAKAWKSDRAVSCV